MCLIFVRDTKSQVEVNYTALKQAFRDNPDGVGFVWWDRDQMQWDSLRAVNLQEKAMTSLVKTLDSQKTPWAVHYRWATEGVIADRNCHPFPLGERAYLMHNGCLPYTPSRKGRSDTWEFAQHVKRIGVSKIPKILDVLEQATIGSRLAYFLYRADGSPRIMKTGRWHYKYGGWFSNTRCFWTPIGYNTNCASGKRGTWQSTNYPKTQGVQTTQYTPPYQRNNEYYQKWDPKTNLWTKVYYDRAKEKEATKSDLSYVEEYNAPRYESKIQIHEPGDQVVVDPHKVDKVDMEKLPPKDVKDIPLTDAKWRWVNDQIEWEDA